VRAGNFAAYAPRTCSDLQLYSLQDDEVGSCYVFNDDGDDDRRRRRSVSDFHICKIVISSFVMLL